MEDFSILYHYSTLYYYSGLQSTLERRKKTAAKVYAEYCVYITGLKIKKSSIPGAGRGVFASDQAFPVKSVFGPYGGRKIFLKNIRFDMDGGYMWDVSFVASDYYLTQSLC